MTQVTIAQLYPVELGVTGDRGNVRAVEARFAARGVQTATVLVTPGEELPADIDVLVIGNGPLSALRGVHADLMGRKERIAAFVADGGVLFSVGGSAELLGEGLDAPDGDRLAGIGVLPYRVARVSDRRVGYIIVDTPDGPVVGFEDHASEWTLADADAAYGTVRDGQGSYARGEGRRRVRARGQCLREQCAGPRAAAEPRADGRARGRGGRATRSDARPCGAQPSGRVRQGRAHQDPDAPDPRQGLQDHQGVTECIR
ncbi:hypothetical protein L2X99_05815 [Microbacterium sp. KUDC0406]|uniref:hypothetical protein n=1 Tax=Microbacterium sp. KUDC0406 TaxID=2909588 RepID=UPI001F3F888B|nr:hypothetical protein [Microbacterium sp. KUDC0406]UJP11095.1 hypothetical protein L2X99_05815 [Microbacterium sp. KUDC0406]